MTLTETLLAAVITFILGIGAALYGPYFAERVRTSREKKQLRSSLYREVIYLYTLLKDGCEKKHQAMQLQDEIAAVAVVPDLMKSPNMTTIESSGAAPREDDLLRYAEQRQRESKATFERLQKLQNALNVTDLESKRDILGLKEVQKRNDEIFNAWDEYIRSDDDRALSGPPAPTPKTHQVDQLVGTYSATMNDASVLVLEFATAYEHNLYDSVRKDLQRSELFYQLEDSIALNVIYRNFEKLYAAKDTTIEGIDAKVAFFEDLIKRSKSSEFINLDLQLLLKMSHSQPFSREMIARLLTESPLSE